MAKLPDPTTTLSPEATKVYEKIARKRGRRVRTRGDLSTLPAQYADAARVVQHVLAHETLPQRLADTPLPEGQRAPF
jgi:hypothetical protein